MTANEHMSTSYRPQGVHLVGSVATPDAETTFRSVSEILGRRAKRIPDGARITVNGDSGQVLIHSETVEEPVGV